MAHQAGGADPSHLPLISVAPQPSGWHSSLVADDYFDEGQAEHYDERVSAMFEPGMLDPAVDLLAELAGDGPALEFGIGTGRIALPLSDRGVPVHGVDLSEAMVARLRAKPGAERLQVTVGDFAGTRVPGSFRLVYLVFNTIGNLTEQDDQVRCFANAAAHLDPGGYFVIEVGVPDLQRLPPGERFRPFTVTDSHLGFDEYDVVTQRLVSHHYWFGPEGADAFSIPFRYVWPSELDLMARLAGLALDQRYAGWDRRPFTSQSGSHVSIWKKPS